jgi:hypothetical protein
VNLPTLRKVQPGDIVDCNVRGRSFLAHAGRMENRSGEDGLVIEPIPGRGSAVSHRFVTADEVVEFYVRGSRPRPRRNRKLDS